MTTTTATWLAELTDALGADGVLTDPDVTALDVHRSLKSALDPAGLLNPGTVFRSAPAAATLGR